MSPLTNQHLTQINRAEKRLLELLPILDKCRNCGIPIEEAEALLNDQLNSLRMYKREFFGNPSQTEKPL